MRKGREESRGGRKKLRRVEGRRVNRVCVSDHVRLILWHQTFFIVSKIVLCLFHDGGNSSCDLDTGNFALWRNFKSSSLFLISTVTVLCIWHRDTSLSCDHRQTISWSIKSKTSRPGVWIITTKDRNTQACVWAAASWQDEAQQVPYGHLNYIYIIYIPHNLEWEFVFLLFSQGIFEYFGKV